MFFWSCLLLSWLLGLFLEFLLTGPGPYCWPLEPFWLLWFELFGSLLPSLFFNGELLDEELGFWSVFFLKWPSRHVVSYISSRSEPGILTFGYNHLPSIFLDIYYNPIFCDYKQCYDEYSQASYLCLLCKHICHIKWDCWVRHLKFDSIKLP